MRCSLLLLCLLFGGCSDFRGADGTPQADAGPDAAPTTPTGDASSPTTDGAADVAPQTDAGGVGDASSLRVSVDPLVTGRSRLGARATGGYHPWRTGIAVHSGQVYWVESGTSPGLFAASASTACTQPSCVQTIKVLTRPTSFFATATDVLVGDVNVLTRVAFADSDTKTIAQGSDEILNLASDGTSVFWTEGTDQAINATRATGNTDAIIYSNGTPVAMAVAGTNVWWVGVDISGLLGAMQTIGVSGTGAHEVGRFSNGFDTMRGFGPYLYYAKDSGPGSVHRLTVATGHDEVVANDAMTVTDFAMDDTWAYWVEAGDGPDYANGRVRRVAHDSMSAQTLAVSIAHPVAIAVSGNTAFVAAAGTSATSWSDGAILRLTIAN